MVHLNLLVQSDLKRKLFFLLGLLMFLNNLRAQTIKVIEAKTKEPISGIAIYNFNKLTYVVTDDLGEADISKFNEEELLYFQNFLYQKKVLTKDQIRSLNNIVEMDFNIEDLNQVVVSASKFEQSKRDVPQKILTIDAQTIAFANPQTSADLLENSGNVFIQKSQLGGGSPMIRGFSTNRLLISVDGVRMNNAIFRGGNLQNVISIDPFTVQKTEITLGAGSVVYGSDAIGGVMSFYTQKPQLSYKDELYFKANAVLRYSDANIESTGHLDLNFGFKKWGFFSSISYSSFGDLRMGSSGPDDYLRQQFVRRSDGMDIIVNNPDSRVQIPTGFSQLSLLQKATFEPSDNLIFDFGLYYSATSDYSRYDRLLRTDDDGLPRSAEWDYGPQEWFMANAQMTKTSSSSNLYDQFQATIAYQNFKESRRDRNFQSVLRDVRSETVDALSLNLDLDKQLNTKANLYYGAEYIYNKIGSKGVQENIETNTSNPIVTRYPDGATWQSAALYTSLKYKPSEAFIFQSGLRYNQVISRANFSENNVFLDLPFDQSDLNSGALTASAGISWLPNNIMEWKFNLSTAFRAPNIDDKGKVFDSEPGAVVVPNDNLKPENAYGGELGLKLNFDNVLILDLGTYYTFLDDALVRRNFELNGEGMIMYGGELSQVQAIQNASKAWLYGFEIGAKINFSNNLSLRTQYNIIDGVEEDMDGEEVPIRHVAPDFGRTHVVWKKNKLEIDAFAVYNAEISFKEMAPSEISKPFIYAQDENGNPFSPSWYTLNLRASYAFNDYISLTASFENITDQRYRPYSSGIAAPGRNIIIAARFSI